MSDFTIGQYYPENSIIHKLDPRVKLLGTLVFIVMLFFINNFVGYGVITIYLLIIIKMSKVPLGKIISGVRGILVVLIISAGLNIFLTEGHVIGKWWIFTITSEGIIRACYLVIRLVYLVIATSIMTLTTKTNDLSDGLEKGLRFLKKIRFPVHEMAMIVSLALRFIPTLLEETEKIKKAQMARGADFESGNIFRRAKSLVPILIPLFVSSIKRAVNLAQAMEARCYHGGKRTKLHPLKYDKKDFIAYAALAFIIISLVAVNIIVKQNFANTFICF